MMPDPSAPVPGEPSSGTGEPLANTDLQTLRGHDAPQLPFPAPTADEIEPLDIIGADTRVEITDTRPVPWCLVCHLVVENDRGAFFTGTGWLGGPSTVYTASHVLLDAKQDHRASRVWVIPGRQGNAGSTLQAVGFETHPQWLHGQQAGVDVAAIWLPSPIGQKLGNFGFKALADAALNNLPIESAGYPDDRDVGRPIGTPMRCSDQIRGVLPQLLATQLDTRVGQSGSPVFVRDTLGRPIALGIHAYGNPMMNHAVRLTADLVKQFVVWWR
jgi:V8-like Glu-specific endopeptidase